MSDDLRTLLDRLDPLVAAPRLTAAIAALLTALEEITKEQK